MSNNLIIKKLKTSPLLIIAVSSLILSLTFSLFPTKIDRSVISQKEDLQDQRIKSTPSSQETKSTLGAAIKKAAYQTSRPTLTTTPTGLLPTATPQPDPTASPTPTFTATPTPAATVTMEIVTPAGTLYLTEEIKDGINVCELLRQGKNEGKISSLTIDESFISVFQSAYVSEINGYKNSWTFTVNGTSPRGCSLYFPKNGDAIVWKFL